MGTITKNQRIQEILNESVAVKTRAMTDNAAAIEEAVAAIEKALKNNGKVILFGNGGSAADSQHIAAEFIGRFQKERAALPAVALTTDSSALTALGNDYGFDVIFSRQIEGLGRAGDVAVGISTSGNSSNCVEALKAAKENGMTTIIFTGEGGGKMAPLADVKIMVPSKNTARIQESHICIAHCIVELVEESFAK